MESNEGFKNRMAHYQGPDLWSSEQHLKKPVNLRSLTRLQILLRIETRMMMFKR